MKQKPILCLDFDGVLHSYTSGWKGAREIPDPPVPGAMRFLVDASKVFDVHIFSSRSHQDGIIAMYKWIACWLEVELGWSAYDAYRFAVDRLRYPTYKPAALVSIDDRAITFTGVWPDPKSLLDFKPWNKK